jgi:hypothetical protein
VLHDNIVICGRGDAGVPVACDLELISLALVISL